MKKIGLAGFGTIGRRVANAIDKQQDMKVVGVSKTTPDMTANIAEEQYGLYGVSNKNAESLDSAGLNTEGTLEDLTEQSDIIVDTSPSGHGEENKSIYEEKGTKAVFQGGEDSNVADQSYNSYVALDKNTDYTECDYLRVVSCNTTGISRLASSIESGIQWIQATLIRRAADPNEDSKGPINDTVRSSNVPSHHAEDVKELYPNLDIHTMAVKVPVTSMHMHSIDVKLEQPEQFDVGKLKNRNRINFIPEQYDETGGQLSELATTSHRSSDSIFENTIWGNTFQKDNGRIRLFQGVHQRGVTVPETIDAIRAINGEPVQESVRQTDENLGITNSRHR